MIDYLARVSLGKTTLQVTRLGLGTAPLGGLYGEVSDADADATIDEALSKGLGLIDTAPQYGHGLAEQRVGRGLARHGRNQALIATKVGRLLRNVPYTDEVRYYHGTPPVNPVFDFSYDGVMRSVEESLARLEVDRVDILHIHDPDDHYDAALEGAYIALDTLRSEGTIDAVGAGMNQSAMLTRLAREADFDCFLVAGRYSLLDQEALDDLLPTCLERRISIIAGGVYNSGLLADPSPGSPYNYRPAPSGLVERAAQLAATCARHRVPLKAAAIQFPFGHPAVACVVTGARSRAELAENIEMIQHPIPADLWEELRKEGLIDDRVPVPD